MDLTYEIVKNNYGEDVIVRSDGWQIPLSEANSDYQTYLASLEENK